MAFRDKDLDHATADLCARLACTELAAKLCAGRPEGLTDAARAFHAFVMEGIPERAMERIAVGRMLS